MGWGENKKRCALKRIVPERQQTDMGHQEGGENPKGTQQESPERHKRSATAQH
jgi:hypothetical protein